MNLEGQKLRWEWDNTVKVWSQAYNVGVHEEWKDIEVASGKWMTYRRKFRKSKAY